MTTELQQNLPLINSIISRAEDKIESMTGLKIKLYPNQILPIIEQTEINKIINVLCSIWQVERGELTAKTRNAKTVAMRKITCMVIRTNFPEIPYRVIAEAVGLGDHATVMYSIQSAANMLVTNDAFFMQFYNPIKTVFIHEKAI